MNDDLTWMNDTLARLAWPQPSAGLHDRILARAQDKTVLVFFRQSSLKISALAMAAMAAGFCFGLLGNDAARTPSDDTVPYYTGSGLYLSQMLGSSS